MSVQHPSSSLVPPAHDDAHSGLADGPSHLVEGVPAAEPALATATADLANLLAHGQWGDAADAGHDPHTSAADAGAYDGHVALALDPGALPDIDSTLDMLTSSHHLFDVPALDVSSVAEDSSST